VPFVAPIYLVGLVPWGALVIWVLTGRRKRERVPFLALWEAPEEVRRPPKKALQIPPVAVALLLLAIPCAILAAAGPIARLHRSERIVTVLVDRGATMSAKGPAGQPRFLEMTQAAVAELHRRPEPVRIRYLTVPQSPIDDPSQIRRTAADTADGLQSTARRLAGSGNPLIVISDHDITTAEDQTILVPPASRPKNAAITLLAANQGQVMVRVRATTAMSRTVRITSGPQTLERRVDLQPDHDADLFLDLKNPAETIEARLVDSDDFDGDDRAWLVRPKTWPTVQVWTAVGDELRRMLDVYAKHRPAADGSKTLAIVRAGDPLKPEEPAILLAPAAGDEQPAPAPQIIDHPILAEVDLSALGRGVAPSSATPGEGWDVLARVNGKPILAVRESEGVRRAWVGFDSRPFARTPDFVLFWTKLLDWAGQGGEGYVFGPLGEIPQDAARLAPEPLPPNADPQHWPGVFRTSQGLIAADAPPVHFPASQSSDWRGKLARLPISAAAGIDLRPWLALAALVLALGAALTWERSRRRRDRPPATPTRQSPQAHPLNRAIA
jgi:hypothetical protein